MSYEKLHVEVEDRIATVTIDNPKVNALSGPVLEELNDAFKELKHNPDVGVMILTGAGKAFVAGADISELNKLNMFQAKRYARKGQHLMGLIENGPKPVVAAVNGFALGGGCELAMACTLRIASENALFGQPEVKLGLIPGFGGTQRLARLVGEGRAMEILLTGENLSAAEAYRIGLANRLVPADKLMDEAKAVARQILGVGPVAARLAKDACHRGLSMELDVGIKLESDLFGMCFATQDAKEGTAAFLERRAPNFTGK